MTTNKKRANKGHVAVGKSNFYKKLFLLQVSSKRALARALA